MVKPAVKDREKIDYHILFNKADDAIILWEKLPGTDTFIVIDVNETACERYGYTFEEFIGLSGTDLNTVQSVIEYKKRMNEFSRNGRGLIELTHLTKSGMPITFESNARLFTFNGRTLILSICRDLTARKQLQEQTLEGLVKSLIHDKLSDTLSKIETATLSNNQIFGDFAFSPSMTAVSYRGKRILLTPSESRLLRALLTKAGRVVTYDELAKALGKQNDATFPKKIRVQVHHLRQKFETDPRNPHVILSKAGKGYCIPSS